ncbi:hypothetical protein F2Q69_00016327 [Brassica cretica]|uniref:Uncharacterized protein n=1 Tax=Brassica cretica TaxID=69181 RepID=A0A8S9R5Z2_BRACR|nr:hypothetical protein F2Q69_00016327 [Brassica cretica]
MWCFWCLLEPFECRAAQMRQMSSYGWRPSDPEVMHVFLKSGQSASREEAVEEMKDCRCNSIGVGQQ